MHIILFIPLEFINLNKNKNMELWECLGFFYYKCQCILNYVYFPLYQHYVIFYLVEQNVL